MYSGVLTAKDINLIPFSSIDKSMKLKAKVCYRQSEQWATVTQINEDTLCIEFDETQRTVTKGQAVVLYDSDTVVGGRTIFSLR